MSREMKDILSIVGVVLLVLCAFAVVVSPVVWVEVRERREADRWHGQWVRNVATKQEGVVGGYLCGHLTVRLTSGEEVRWSKHEVVMEGEAR